MTSLLEAQNVTRRFGGGFLQKWGVLDFAGGMVVHTSAGFAALASVWVVGARRFGPDEKTQKPMGSIEYEISKVGGNEKLMNFSEDVASIPNASASQVTIEKLLPLNSLPPGTYTLLRTWILPVQPALD